MGDILPPFPGVSGITNGETISNRTNIYVDMQRTPQRGETYGSRKRISRGMGKLARGVTGPLGPGVAICPGHTVQWIVRLLE